ncbi:hypothetical protein [Rhodoplanes roseus]|uniref:hypothetical protein n=1 Tax=Rhodoplanes roseus TaxID=29409 RepID=UPI0011B5C842|nr:hypothetical protein [Rhodoplanes roseus]
MITLLSRVKRSQIHLALKLTNHKTFVGRRILTYRIDFSNSARRHLNAAKTLFETTLAANQVGNKAVAGYLYGISGELAVKEMMRRIGIKPLTKDERRDDPFFAHFPQLKTLIRDGAAGRRSGRLRTVAVDARLFRDWNTDMRYASTSDIDSNLVASWKQHAESLVAEMDLP